MLFKVIKLFINVSDQLFK